MSTKVNEDLAKMTHHLTTRGQFQTQIDRVQYMQQDNLNSNQVYVKALKIFQSNKIILSILIDLSQIPGGSGKDATVYTLHTRTGLQIIMFMQKMSTIL
jgi:hypothetical protein